jgi:uncharacterized protein (UPF0276 family)
MHFTDIPTLGIGLAADVAGAVPNYRKFLPAGGPDSVDYFSFGAHHVQQARVEHYLADLVEQHFPMVFHPVNFNPATSEIEEPDVIEGTRSIAEYVSAIWMGQDVGIWAYRGHYLGPMLIPAILDPASVTETAAKVRYLQRLMPCPFLIENPPVNASLECMHMLDFMRQVSEEADCGIVLDIGHLVGYQQATGRERWDMPLEKFPFDRVVEIHIAGLQFSRVGPHLNLIDQHAYPVHEWCWELLKVIGPQLTGLRGLTLEQEYCEDSLVLQHLRRARALVEELGLFSNAH